MPKRIYLSSPYTHGEEMQFVKEAFDTNWLAPVGKNIDGLEAEINATLNRGTASGYRSLALISGTSALHLALKPGEHQAGRDRRLQRFDILRDGVPRQL